MKNTSKIMAVTALTAGLLVGGGAWGYQAATVDLCGISNCWRKRKDRDGE